MERGRCLLEEKLSELTAHMAQAQKDMLSASVGAIDVLQDHLMEQLSDLLKTATDPAIFEGLSAAIRDRLEVLSDIPDAEQMSHFPEEEQGFTPQQERLLLREFLPMLNGNPTNVLMGVSSEYLTPDTFTGVSTFSKDGRTIRIKDFSEVSAHLGTLTKKLVDTAALMFNFRESATRGG